MTHSSLEDATSPGPSETNAGFRLLSVDRLPVMEQEESCHIIKQYFDYLDSALSRRRGQVDVELLRAMLLEISQLLRSGKSPLREDGYLRLLDRLTAIYAKGLRMDDDLAFARTAANFADILDSVSQTFQDYDYSQSVGLLLHYMDKLFNYQEESWLDVLEHLLSMPDSIHIMHQLRSRHLREIQNWVEEGVDNLFTIRIEQLELIDNLEQTLETLDREIRHNTNLQMLKRKAAERRGVIELSNEHRRRHIDSLRDRRHGLILEREAKLELVELLNVNIKEFAERLGEIRRVVLLKLVWSNPQPA